jgi:CheY-like chemotaxis protein
MSRRVLLVDADVNALGALASSLRARGLTVYNASEVYEAVEQAFKHRPDVILFTKDVDGEAELAHALRAVPEIAAVPVLRLVRHARIDELGPADVLRADLDEVISRISEASPREPRPSIDQEIRGDIEQMPLVDLLQLLSMNRRSGVLGITTTTGAGEVRLADGEVVDAVYKRLEGEKALFRLLTEREGRFAFSSGEAPAVRRITSPTSQLLMEAMHQVDEVKRQRAALSPEGEALLFDDAAVASHSRPPDLPGERAALARELTLLLENPRAIDEILDECSAPDLIILDVLSSLMAAGKIRRVPIAELTTPFAPPEQLPVLRSLVTRLTRPGFAPPPRIIIAASEKRMVALAASIRRISDTTAPLEPPLATAVPRPLGTLRLGDGVDLALTGLPTEDAFAPVWALALPGAAVVVRLNDAGGPALESHCEAIEVMLIDAESVMGAIDVAVPGQVAALIRSALELVAGV